jgi:hypothetical protein
MLEVYKLVHIVFLCKSIRQLMLVFIEPSKKIIGHTDVHDLIVPIREYIDVEIIVSHYYS